ncbi:MAG: glycosyltransferase [Steroidobacteraceae bacterium]|nr:glycosyltransferase [Steroidobacteraceae bacterium]
MKNVCLFNFPPMADFHGYRLETFDPFEYIPKRAAWSLADLITGGLNGFNHRRAILHGAAGVDRLYRERNPHYMRMIREFVERFHDFDLIIMATYNFVHPEVLHRDLSKPVKIMGFVDDPMSTYVRGIPYLWAFDGAFYISPSYIDDRTFEESLRRWTRGPVTWFPLVYADLPRSEQPREAFLRNRDVDIVYVGNPTGSKVERLIRLKQHFGDRIRIHGRWPLRGYMGFARGLLGKPIYPYRVTRLSTDERTRLYWRTKIGFNMHVSESPTETGNARMYEVPAHGMMLVCDKAGGNAHERIFRPGSEAVYYDSIEEAIELVEYYLQHDEERLQIAAAGFDRFWKDYNWETNLRRLLDWAACIPKNSASAGALRAPA